MKSFLYACGGFFSFIISILVYIIVIALLLIVSVKNIFSFSTINSLVQKIEVKTLLNDIDDDNNVLDIVYSTAQKNNINNESVDKLLNSYDIKYLVSKYIYGGIYFLTTSKEDKILTSNEFNNYVADNIDKVMTEAAVDDSEKDIMLNELTNNSDTIIKSLPDVKTIVEQIDENTLYYIRLVLSSKTILILTLILVCLILLLMACRWSIYKWLNWFGIPMMCSSLICISVGLLPMFKIESLVPGLPNYIINIIESSASIISSKFIVNGIISFAIGLFLVLLNQIIKKRKSLV